MIEAFEKWADLPVPPPPSNFERRFRERLNRALVAEQLIDGVVRGLGSAGLEFGAALVGGALWSLQPSRQNSSRDQSLPVSPVE
jgi:hypothetical protein